MTRTRKSLSTECLTGGACAGGKAVVAMDRLLAVMNKMERERMEELEAGLSAALEKLQILSDVICLMDDMDDVPFPGAVWDECVAIAKENRTKKENQDD